MEIKFQANIDIKDSSIAAWKADCVILPLFEGKDGLEGAKELLEKAPWLSISPAWRDFSGKAGSAVMLYGHPDLPISRILLVGLGRAEKFKPGALRKAISVAVKRCREHKLESIALAAENIDYLCNILNKELELKRVKNIPTGVKGNMESAGEALNIAETRDKFLEEAVLSVLLASYTCEGYHNKRDRDAEDKRGAEVAAPKNLCILFTERHIPDSAHAATRKAEAVAAGIFLSRDLVNGPANIITPTHLAEQASKLARQYGFNYELLNMREIRDEGMGAFWAVAQGAREEPCLIVLEHCPKGAEDQEPLIFIGKGITFDSGGISLKPAAKMHEMKGDMAGAAAVLGLFAALGESSTELANQRVIGLLPCTENMPDGNATRPGDIITTLSGKTVEITNTDAEGRLVLCDTMTLAQKRWKPRFLIDIATLTGACVVALGDQAAGLFCTSDELAKRICRQGEAMGERFWRLPLWEDQEDKLKSDVADFNNVGPREGGSLWAALFLSQFVDEGITWAHLDIAGPGYISSPSSMHPGGGTGFGLRTMYELACGN